MPGGKWYSDGIQVSDNLPKGLRAKLIEWGHWHESQSERAQEAKELGMPIYRALVYQTDKPQTHRLLTEVDSRGRSILPKFIQERITIMEKMFAYPAGKRWMPGEVKVMVRREPVNEITRQEGDPETERIVYFFHPTKRGHRAFMKAQKMSPDRIAEDIIKRLRELKLVLENWTPITMTSGVQKEFTGTDEAGVDKFIPRLFKDEKQADVVLVTIIIGLMDELQIYLEGPVSSIVRWNKFNKKATGDVRDSIFQVQQSALEFKKRDAVLTLLEQYARMYVTVLDEIKRVGPGLVSMQEWTPDESVESMEPEIIDESLGGEEPSLNDGIDNYSRCDYNCSVCQIACDQASKYDWASVDTDFTTASALMRVIRPKDVKPPYITKKFDDPKYQVYPAKTVKGLTHTSWFRAAYLSSIFMKDIDSLVSKGKPFVTPQSAPQLFTDRNIGSLSVRKNLLEAAKKSRADRLNIVVNYLRDRAAGVLATPSKPLLSIASSPTNCNPTMNCARYCYAFGGQGGVTSNLYLVELIEYVVRVDPKVAGELVMEAIEQASRIKLSGELKPLESAIHKFAPKILNGQTAIRFFDRGEGGNHTNWLKVIDYVNSRDVRCHVFSKRADFLATINPKNVRILSADSTNFKDAIEGAVKHNLKIGYVYVSSMDDANLLEIGADRLALILPVKSAGSRSDKEGVIDLKAREAMHNFLEGHPAFAPFVCPKDYRGFWTPSGYKAMPNVKFDNYHCDQCDTGVGKGCFYKHTTAHSWKVGQSASTMEEPDEEAELPPYPPPPPTMKESEWKKVVDMGVKEFIDYVKSFDIVTPPSEKETIELMDAMSKLGIKMPEIGAAMVNRDELETGVDVEGEHTMSKVLAMLIALGHLEEKGQEHYYTNLHEMEQAAKKMSRKNGEVDFAKYDTPSKGFRPSGTEPNDPSVNPYRTFDKWVVGQIAYLATIDHKVTDDQVRKSPAAWKYANKLGILQKK